MGETVGLSHTNRQECRFDLSDCVNISSGKVCEVCLGEGETSQQCVVIGH